MDLQMIAIAVAVVIIALILLACFLFASRERTFEDALAQQQGLGILLSNKQQAGKTTEKHKEKHKTHHQQDGGGGGAKKKSQQPLLSSKQHVDSAAVSSPNAQKVEKSKEVTDTVTGRLSSTSSSTTEEKRKENRGGKHSPSAKEGPKSKESSRSRQSSNSEGSSKKTRETQATTHQQQQPDNKVNNKESEALSAADPFVEEKKPTAKKSGGKKHRRDDQEDAAPASASTQAQAEPIPDELGDHKAVAPHRDDNKIEVEQNYLNGGPSSETLEVPSHQPTSKKGGQKKKHKKQHQFDDEHATELENKENIAAGDNQFQKVVAATMENVPPSKIESANSNAGEYNVENIIEKLKTSSSLTNVQLQYVSDALVSKHGDLKQQTAKKDDLKKQLDENEKALAQETQLVASVNQKLKELRQQLDVEKNRSIASERTYVEQLSGKQRELQSAQQKVQELNGQCAQLSTQSRRAQEQLMNYQKLLEQSPNPTQVQQLREENQRLKDRIGRSEQESRAFGADLQRLRQELSQRDAQLHQAEQRFMHLQQTLTIQESNQAQQTAEYQQKQAAKEVAYAQLEQELANVRREWSLLEITVHELRQQQPNVVVSQNGQEPTVGKAQISELNAANDKLTSNLADSKALVASLEKRLANVDKELKESQATLKRQNDHLQNEINQYRDQLEQATRERAKMESAAAENTKLAALTKSTSEKIEQLEKTEKETRHQLDVEKKARLSSEAQVTKLLAERDSAASGHGPEETSKKLEGELETMKQERRDLEKKIQSLLQENRKLTEQAAAASINGHSDGASADALKIQELSLTHLNKQLIAKDGEIAQLKQSLDQQRQKNSELRERNQKVVEAMNQLEKTSKELSQKMETKYEKQLEEQEKQAKLAVSKFIPHAKIPEKSSFLEWIKEAQLIAAKQSKSSEENIRSADQKRSKDENSSKRENVTIHSDVTAYQQALKQTEIALKSIEDSAARHERIWRERVMHLEKELENARSCQNVDLTSASLTAARDSEEKLRVIRLSLETGQKERSTYKAELEQLRKDIENERHDSRDLSSQVVKLRGMLKTGQDALKQEQELVAQLQKQLKGFQETASTTSNDAKDGKGEQQLHDELNELRTKLSQREQQLEREMSINKHLNNKLASLGVSSPPSAIVGNSNGSL